MKHFLTKLKINILGFLGGCIVELFYCTWRMKGNIFLHEKEKYECLNRPVVLVFWHEQQLLLPFLVVKHLLKKFEPYRKPYALISGHRDGQILARAMKVFGVGSVAGSSTSGGRQATIKLLKIVREGYNLAVATDGPKGPIYVCKPGAIKMAQISGAALVPIAATANRVWRFKSWDKLQLPKPFASVHALVGEPIFIARDADDATFNATAIKVQNALNDLTQRVLSSAAA